MASLKHSTGFEVGFPTGRDSATFWVKGTEVPSLSRDKGTTGQAKNLAKGRDRPAQPKCSTRWAGIANFACLCEKWPLKGLCH